MKISNIHKAIIGITTIVSILILLFNTSFITLFSNIGAIRSQFFTSMILLNSILLLTITLLYVLFKNKVPMQKFDSETKKFFVALLVILILFVTIIWVGNVVFKVRELGRTNVVDWKAYPGKFFDLERNIFVEINNMMLESEISPNKIEIPIYYLYIKEENLNQLNSNLPFSGTEYVSGYFKANNELYSSNVRYRGDFFTHWGAYKKSWRIKLKDKKLVNKFNKFNLINPKTIGQMDSVFLSDLFENTGVLSPEMFNIALYINEKYSGVYEYRDQIDETFLRKNSILPSDIFAKDFVRDENQWIVKNTTELEKWEIPATYDNNKTRAIENLKFLIQNIYEKDSDKFYIFFKTYFDEDYLNFMAQRTIIHDVHTDETHNLKLYFDPSSGKYVPIAWDQLIEKIEPNFNLDIPGTGIDKQIIKHPEFVQKKNELLFEQINLFDENKAIESIENAAKKIEYPLTYDIHKDEMAFGNITLDEWKIYVNELKENIVQNYSYIRKKLEETNMVITLVESKKLIFGVDGISAVKVKNISNNCIRVKKFLLNEDSFCLGDKEGHIFYPGRTPSKGEDGTNTKTVMLHYIFDLNNVNTIESLENLRFYNATTNQQIFPKIEKKESFSENEWNYLNENYSRHPWLNKKIKTKNLVWSGNIIVNEKTILSENDVLTISPGTTIKLKKGGSIVSFGKINAIGTKEKPINFIPYSNEPWGAITLQGKNAHGEFQHINMYGGSGVKHELVNYTGMISIYNASANIKNSIFSNNYQQDDMINAKKSVVNIENCIFRNSFGDSIDFDISKGKIISTLFENSTNDSIDLMTSDILIQDVNILMAKDKGISIGENSNPTIENVRIIDSNVAIAIKDNSHPKIKNITLKSNNIAFSAYQKNWRYGNGGFGTIYSGDYCNNKKILELDKLSELTFLINENEISCSKSECNGVCE